MRLRLRVAEDVEGRDIVLGRGTFGLVVQGLKGGVQPVVSCDAIYAHMPCRWKFRRCWPNSVYSNIEMCRLRWKHCDTCRRSRRWLAARTRHQRRPSSARLPCSSAQTPTTPAVPCSAEARRQMLIVMPMPWTSAASKQAAQARQAYMACRLRTQVLEPRPEHRAILSCRAAACCLSQNSWR